MALHQSGIVSTLRHAADCLYLEITSGSSRMIRIGRYLLLAVVVMAVSGAAFLGYRWYVSYREQQAQLVFASYLQDYYKALQGSADHQARTSLGMELIAQQQSGSYLAPYFLAARASLEVRQGKLDEAIVLMDQAIAKLSAKDSLAPLLKTKRALMMLDSANEQTKRDGLANLIALAQDKNNKQRDVALFYLGEYQWSQDKEQDAKDAWQELMQLQQQEHGAPSPWAQLVHERISSIS